MLRYHRLQLDVTSDPLRLNLSRSHFDILMSVIFGTVTSLPLKFLRPEREVCAEARTLKAAQAHCHLLPSFVLKPPRFLSK